MEWIEYSWGNKRSHPPGAGRYLIYRAKCDKMHFEQWNGNGWSSSNKDCTHWSSIKIPTIKNKKNMRTFILTKAYELQLGNSKAGNEKANYLISLVREFDKQHQTKNK